MKKQYTEHCAVLPRGIGIFLLAFLLSGFACSRASAQQNIPVTGFNSDQVAEGTGAPSGSTTAIADNGVDGGQYTFIDGTYQYNATCPPYTTNILPANRLISSTAIPGLVYELQSYTGNNALRIPATGVLAGTGTLTLTTPVSAGALYLLSVAGGGPIPNGINVTVTFTDATTQNFTNLSAEDWCNLTTNASYTKIATTNYYRVQASSVTGCGAATCQYFAEMALPISAANQSKQVASVTVSKTTGSCVMNIYAMGSVPPCAAPAAQPTTLTPTTLSTGYISGSFTAASPAASGYLVVRYPQGATPVAPVNGTAYTAGQTLGTGVVVQASASTSFTSNGLTPNTPYDFYVYSYFGPCVPLSANPTYQPTAPLMATLTTTQCGGSFLGTHTVGSGGAYFDITTALNAIGSQGLSGPVVLELLPTYSSASETFPITFQGDPCSSAGKPITIRPHSSNTVPLSITSNHAAATIDLNGARYITFDGRPGGAGWSKMLSIVNTNATGVAIRLVNDASQNTITFCDVQGQNTSSTTGAASAQVGVISFGTASSVFQNGNDSNTISYSDIHATAGGFPAIGIASFGNSAATPVKAWNDFNTIDHCNIFDMFHAASASTAIKADGGSNAFVVTNNRVFQTATRTYTAGANHRAFWLTPTATGASGFVVTNNFIGGSDSLGTGTYTMLGGGTAVNYWAMDINHGGTVHTSIQGNTITNISLTNTATTGNLFRGISTGGAGHMDIGTVTGNTIGSLTANGAITVQNNSSGSIAYGIVCGNAAPDSVKVHNNTIAGITTGSANSNIGVHIMGIGITSGNYASIHNNTIGSPTTANSLHATSAPTSTQQSICGIAVTAGTYTAVTENRITNLTNNSVSTSVTTTVTNPSFTRGISMTTSTTSVVRGNKIRNISTGSTSTGTGTSAALTGVFVNTGNPATISGNSVDSLVLAPHTSTNGTNIDGMFVGLNGSAPTHLVTGNFVHHLIAHRLPASTATINGIQVLGGSNIVANNMVQLGLNTDGSSYDSAVTIRGIYLNTSTATNLYHNSVYIGGSAVANASRNTFAFVRNATTGAHDLKNNIFVNQRSNAVTGGKHYQVYLNAATSVTLGSNIYYGTGTGSVFATSNNAVNDITTFVSGWLSSDAGSVSANPQFINPNGGSVNSGSMADLHLNPVTPTPAEGSGTAVASVTEDFDGDTRANITPVDIGADAGLFTAIGMSIDSTVADQVTSVAVIGSLNQPVIAIRVHTKGAVSPLTLTALKLSTIGSTSAADIVNAKVYYTGSSATFGTGTPFGSPVASPSGTFYVNGSQTLSVGANYFWVAYDISASATAGNLIDAALDSVGISGGASASIITGNPAGARTLQAPLSGPYSIGSGGNYATIGAALTDLSFLGVKDPVTFVLLNNEYSVATGETFPITLRAYTGASATNKITFMPAPGATPVILGKTTTPIIRIDGGKYYEIDGRQGGTTMPKSLTIQNNDTLSGSAVDFVNDASFNVLRHAVIKGSSSNETIGVVNFGTGITTGNDSNTIEYCNITSGDSLPATLVQGRGSINAETAFNNGNVIDHCELFNYFKAYGESNAFKISKGNTAFRITNNSIYQPVARKYPQIHYTFNWNRIVENGPNNPDDAMAKASLNNMVVSGNYFGGSAPQCGGAPWTQDSSTGIFCSYFNLGDQLNSRFSHNTFTNFNITSLSANANPPGAWNAIQFVGGRLDIDSNIIGSSTDPAAIRITAGGGATIYPLAVTGAANGTFRIRGNQIGGMTVGGRGPASVNIQNLFISTGSASTVFRAEYNRIGDAAITVTPSSSTTAQSNIGINNTGGGVLHVRNNVIHNLFNQHAATGTSQTIGIRSSGGFDTITNNLVDSLDNTTAQLGTGVNAATIGISYTATTGNGLIAQNTIHRISASHATEAVAVTGIYYAGGTGDVLGRNLVHSLGTVSASQTSVHTGIQVNGGTARIQNNMVRMGIDADGISQTVSPLMYGLNLTGGNTRAFFNSVYIGGMGVSGAANSFAVNRSGTGTDSLYNNIFSNERQGGTGTHYAVGLNNSNNLKANYNLYYIGTGPVLGLYNNTPKASMAAWKTDAGVDAGSNAGNPAFSNPAGGISTISLHIGGVTPVEGSGLLIGGIDEDFDGEARSGFTPTDIGADAGNFILSDIFGPTISYAAIPSDTVAPGLVLNSFATIIDPSSIDLSSNLPRLYYKKKTDNNTFAGNSASDNGWKFVMATNAASPFSFMIDYSIINGGSVSVTDTIQYFVTAQDMLGNVSANPAVGFTAASVNSVFTAPTVPSFYRIKVNPLRGTYQVGAGQAAPNFTTLTSAVATLNSSGVGAAVTFELTDASYTTASGESFPLQINAVEGGSSINTVTIKPAAGATPAVGGNAAAIFRLNGADNIVIDGSNTAGGTTRDLTLADSNNSSAVVWLVSEGTNAGAENITIKHTNLRGSSSTAGYGIFSGGNTLGSAGAHNHNLTMLNNRIVNAGFGIYVNGAAGSKHNAVTITGNLIGDSAASAPTVGQVGIYLSNVNSLTVSGNTLLNIASAYTTNGGPHGISLQSGVTNANLFNNVINRVAYTGSGYYGGKGIDVNTGDANSNIEIRNNMVANIYGDGWNAIGTDAILGMRVTGTSGNIRVYYNTVTLNATATGGTANSVSAAFYAAAGVTNLTVRNNIFYNPMFNASITARAYAIVLDATSGYTIDNNNYLVAGAQGVLAARSGVDHTTIAAWRTATGQDAGSKNVNVTFASVNDLHLAGASNGDFALAGAPVAGITTDIDGNTRHVTFPYMGADEASIPLPVELLAFTGRTIKGDVQLSWATASERNNKGFDAERSADGINFSRIGFVKGAGNSARRIAYSLTDAGAFEKAGSNTLYYRLKQVDLNGRYSYSATVIVHTGDNPAKAAVVAYPNPFATDLTVQLEAERGSDAGLELIDLSGRTVMSEIVQLNEGMNQVTLNSIPQLQAGLYLLKVTVNGQVTVVKVSRQ